MYNTRARTCRCCIHPVVLRLSCSYTWHTTTTWQRKAPLPVGALLWFSVRHVDNELIIVITHALSCIWHVCMCMCLQHAHIYIHIYRIWPSCLVKIQVCWHSWTGDSWAGEATCNNQLCSPRRWVERLCEIEIYLNESRINNSVFC